MTLNKQFTAALRTSPSIGGWTYVAMSRSAPYSSTGGQVEVRGPVDGHSFQSPFIGPCDGLDELPIKSELQKAIVKEPGIR